MCADDLDNAAELTDHFIAVALANRKRPVIESSGRCLWCGEVISGGNFCGPECRDDHALRCKINIITGKNKD